MRKRNQLIKSFCVVPSFSTHTYTQILNKNKQNRNSCLFFGCCCCWVFKVNYFLGKNIPPPSPFFFLFSSSICVCVCASKPRSTLHGNPFCSTQKQKGERKNTLSSRPCVLWLKVLALPFTTYGVSIQLKVFFFFLYSLAVESLHARIYVSSCAISY